MATSRASTPGGRPHRVSTALSSAELADFDARRGSLDRSQMLRWLVNDARRRGVSFGGEVSTREAVEMLESGT